MHCPNCKEVELVMAERQGIEIDYCPKCRGVWLDRGELDKIIERTLKAESAGFQQAPPESHGGQQPTRQYGHDDHHRYGHGTDKYHDRHRSFWKDLFD